VKTWTLKQHNGMWKQLTACYQTKTFVKDVNDQVGKHLLRLNKQELSILVGALTGHNALNKHIYKIGVRNSPMCDFCNKTESSFNFVAECGKYSLQRLQYFGSAILSTKDVSDIQTKD